MRLVDLSFSCTASIEADNVAAPADSRGPHADSPRLVQLATSPPLPRRPPRLPLDRLVQAQIDETHLSQEGPKWSKISTTGWTFGERQDGLVLESELLLGPCPPHPFFTD